MEILHEDVVDFEMKDGLYCEMYRGNIVVSGEKGIWPSFFSKDGSMFWAFHPSFLAAIKEEFEKKGKDLKENVLLPSAESSALTIQDLVSLKETFTASEIILLKDKGII